MEINGDSTTGMTHSQAVERIRTAGHHIHLVLKRGNGYVPDYGKTDGDRERRNEGKTTERGREKAKERWRKGNRDEGIE